MEATPVPKFVWSVALDFPDICPQFFVGNVSRQEREKITHNTRLYIFTRLLNRQDGLQNRDSI